MDEERRRRRSERRRIDGWMRKWDGME